MLFLELFLQHPNLEQTFYFCSFFLWFLLLKGNITRINLSRLATCSQFQISFPQFVQKVRCQGIHISLHFEQNCSPIFIEQKVIFICCDTIEKSSPRYLSHRWMPHHFPVVQNQDISFPLQYLQKILQPMIYMQL